jgi:hypothetical protein
MLSIIPAAARTSSMHRVTAFIAGPPGIGKTSLARLKGTTAIPATLFVDGDAGTLSIADLKIDIIHLQHWQDCLDLNVRICGIDPVAMAGAPYSAEHLERAGGPLPGLEKYQTIFIDGFSEIARKCLYWAATQPEAFSEKTGRKDVRGTYGLVGRDLPKWVQRFQHVHGTNIIVTCVLELRSNEFGLAEWRPQIEGSKTAREIGAIFDEIITLQWVSFGDDKPPIRAFVCTTPNLWNYPAKDRSGKLNQLEEPHLGKLISKLNGERL